MFSICRIPSAIICPSTTDLCASKTRPERASPPGGSSTRVPNSTSPAGAGPPLWSRKSTKSGRAAWKRPSSGTTDWPDWSGPRSAATRAQSPAARPTPTPPPACPRPTPTLTNTSLSATFDLAPPPTPAVTAAVAYLRNHPPWTLTTSHPAYPHAPGRPATTPQDPSTAHSVSHSIMSSPHNWQRTCGFPRSPRRLWSSNSSRWWISPPGITNQSIKPRLTVWFHPISSRATTTMAFTTPQPLHEPISARWPCRHRFLPFPRSHEGIPRRNMACSSTIPRPGVAAAAAAHLPPPRRSLLSRVWAGAISRRFPGLAATVLSGTRTPRTVIRAMAATVAAIIRMLNMDNTIILNITRGRCRRIWSPSRSRCTCLKTLTGNCCWSRRWRSSGPCSRPGQAGLAMWVARSVVRVYRLFPPLPRRPRPRIRAFFGMRRRPLERSRIKNVRPDGKDGRQESVGSITRDTFSTVLCTGPSLFPFFSTALAKELY